MWSLSCSDVRITTIVFFACVWYGTSPDVTSGEQTVTRQENQAVVDLAFAVSIQRTGERPEWVNLLTGFVRRLQLGENKTRVAMIDITTGQLDTKVKLEDGTSIRPLKNFIINDIAKDTSSETSQPNQLKQLGEDIAKGDILPSNSRGRPQIVFIFTTKTVSGDQVVDRKSGAQIVAFVNVQKGDAQSPAMYLFYGYFNNHTTNKSPRPGRIARAMTDLIKTALRVCPFDKIIDDCYYEDPEQYRCVADVRYESNAMDDDDKKLCLTKKATTIACRNGTLGEQCEETCDRSAQPWSECSTTMCGEYGVKHRTVDTTNSKIKHCLTTTACEPKSCEITEGTRKPSKTGTGRAKRPKLGPLKIIVFTLGAVNGLVWLIALGLAFHAIRVKKGKVALSGSAQAKSGSLAMYTFAPPSITSTPADVLVKQYAKSAPVEKKAAVKAKSAKAPPAKSKKK